MGNALALQQGAYERWDGGLVLEELRETSDVVVSVDRWHDDSTDPGGYQFFRHHDPRSASVAIVERVDGDEHRVYEDASRKRVGEAP